MKKLHPVEIVTIHPGVPDYPGHFILYLKEKKGNRELQIILGIVDAQFIALEKEKLVSIRPLVHELLQTVIKTFKLNLVCVEINKWEDGIFFSDLVFEDGTRIDCRPSDAIVLALKDNLPILVAEEILQEVGYEENFDDQIIDSSVVVKADDLIKSLNHKLDEAIKKENYSEAAKIRDKIAEIISDTEPKSLKKPKTSRTKIKTK